VSCYSKEDFRWSCLAVPQLQKRYNLDTGFFVQFTLAQSKTFRWGHVVVQIKSNNSYPTKGFRAPFQLPNPILSRRKSFALWQRHENPQPLKGSPLTSSLPYSELQFLFLVLCDLLLCSWGSGINCEGEMKLDKYGRLFKEMLQYLPTTKSLSVQYPGTKIKSFTWFSEDLYQYLINYRLKAILTFTSSNVCLIYKHNRALKVAVQGQDDYGPPFIHPYMSDIHYVSATISNPIFKRLFPQLNWASDILLFMFIGLCSKRHHLYFITK
jgi:hypothetical protein